MTEKQKRVLIVEDNLGILRLLTLELKLQGYDVINAQNGQEAMEQVELKSPDIMLLDLNLPIMNGLEVIRRLRGFSRMPVIVISSHTEMAQKALILGAELYIPKPFDPEYIVEKIKELLKE